MDGFVELKQIFGHSGFRPGQEEIVNATLGGRDALGVMPTGAGKSICYQLPAMRLDGITLVISPLISLMKDQVMSLIQTGVPAAYINSSLTPTQMRMALSRAAEGRYKIIYVAPERLETAEFIEFAMNAGISMVTVDEAHCISQWGQDFRPSYLKIRDFIDRLPARPVVSAFTATATERVRLDIMEILELRNPCMIITGFDRPNLFFAIQKPKDKTRALLRFLEDKFDAPGIVYCSTRKQVEQVEQELTSAGFSATRYHAGLSDSERTKNQDDFQFDRKRIMVATNAFGMGIDKSNVTFVVHYNMPKDIESYYQEAGRAGRDGEKADCLLLYSGQDVIMARWMINNQDDNPELAPMDQALLRQRDFDRLKQMTFYSTSKRCLRKFILNYFGEREAVDCGNCSVCIGQEYEPVEEAKPKAKKSKRAEVAVSSDPMYEELVKLRNQLAQQAHMPAYVIFSNATLRDMAAKKPLTDHEMLQVSGVGKQKLMRYGPMFMALIKSQMAVVDAGTLQHDADGPAAWSFDEDDRLHEEYMSGKGIGAIAAAHERSDGDVRLRLRKMGLIE